MALLTPLSHIKDGKVETGKERIQHLNALAEKLDGLNQTIAARKQELAALEAQKDLLEKQELPDYMLEIGLQATTLLNGKKIEVKPFFYARIPSIDEEDAESVFRREDALSWLRLNGHAGLIKENLIIMPNHEQMALILDFLREVKTPYEEKSNVHWKTMEAWLKEQMGKKANIPLEKFNAFVGRKATVK